MTTRQQFGVTLAVLALYALLRDYPAEFKDAVELGLAISFGVGISYIWSNK